VVNNMAIIAKVDTRMGEKRSLYIRANSSSASNHGVESTMLFRGFLSKEAFDNGASYVWEQTVNFYADITLPLWEQAYSELKKDIEVNTEDV